MNNWKREFLVNGRKQKNMLYSMFLDQIRSK
jgi:hypothetical protein